MQKPPAKAILVIDDQAIARSTVRRQLEYYGFTVLEGASAIEGLKIFYQERGRIGLVLLDLVLPDLSGEEALRRLRKLDPQVQIALCSEEMATQTKAREEYQGVAGVIRKPVRTDRLLAVVRKAFGL